MTVYEVLGNKTLREIYNPSGGAWGGIKVDEGFTKTLQTLLGEDVYEEFARENKPDYLDLQRDFELKKRMITDETEKVHIRVPVSLCNLINEKLKMTLTDVIQKSPFADEITFKRDRMHISGKVMRKMFEQPIRSIVKHTREILDRKTNDIEIILMIGGFAESTIVRKAIEDEFGHVRVVSPVEPGLCVVKGAVLFGHCPTTISSRVSKYTYGVAVQGDFVTGVHPENKKQIINNEAVCSDVFSKFVEIGQELAVGKMTSKIYGVTHRNRSVNVAVFASSETYPILTTDKSSSKLGEIIVLPPNGGWAENTDIQVAMSFSGTEFNVKATDVTTKKSYSTTFDFLN